MAAVILQSAVRVSEKLPEVLGKLPHLECTALPGRGSLSEKMGDRTNRLTGIPQDGSTDRSQPRSRRKFSALYMTLENP